MVHILFTKLPDEFILSDYHQKLRRLPLPLQTRNRQYRRWQDQLANLYGKLLLIKGLTIIGRHNYKLQEIQYTMNGRPYFENDGNQQLDFNISHSDAYVVCAVTAEQKVGIDIEAIKPVDLNDFRHILTEEEWEVIQSSNDPIRSFFELWTIKESVIKADGRGLSIDLNAIKVSGPQATYEAATWHLNELEIDEEYAAHLALSGDDTVIEVEYTDHYYL